MLKNFNNTAARSLAALVMVSASAAYAADDGFSIQKRPHKVRGDFIEIRVVSQMDAAVINDILVNRGNCGIANSYGSDLKSPLQPIKVKYGTEFTIFATNFCRPTEVSLVTDKGVYKTNWDR